MSYSVKEVFVTLQGEGRNAGRRAVFTRFAGCNLWTGRPEDREKGKGECARWCDTDFFRGEKYEADALVTKMNDAWGPSVVNRLCVLTGGEPALQLDDVLLKKLWDEDWEIAVETNGTVENPALIGFVDHICVSPKLGGPVRSEYLANASEVKVVLPGHVDPAQGWTEEQLLALAQQAGDASLYVQPQDPLIGDQVESTVLHLGRGRAPYVFTEQLDRNVQQCIEFVMKHSQWRLTSQNHKLWNLR